MPKIVTVETNGALKELNCRDVSEANLYKVIKLKNSAGFALQTTWNLTIGEVVFNISLYSKTDGRAGQENKYDFPPPVDSSLFFGKCVLVNQNGDLSVSDWNRVYEHLFGGFEDLNSDGDDEDDEDEYDDLPLTAAGYAKDGFVVDSETEVESIEDEDEEEEIDSDSDDSTAKKKKKKSKPKAKTAPKTKVKAVAKSKVVKNKAAEPYVDCSEELTEEAYV
jgi:hypothetical protein